MTYHSNPYSTGDTYYRHYVTLELLTQVRNGKDEARLQLPDTKRPFTPSERELIWKHAMRCLYNSRHQQKQGYDLCDSHNTLTCDDCGHAIRSGEAHFHSMETQKRRCINCSDYS